MIKGTKDGIEKHSTGIRLPKVTGRSLSSDGLLEMKNIIRGTLDMDKEGINKLEGSFEEITSNTSGKQKK